MRPVVAVDLAAKFSAGMLLAPDGEVVRQWDSYDWTHSQVAERVFSDYMVGSTKWLTLRPLVVIEDLPPHVPGSDVKRAVYQLQGRILHAFATGPGQWAGRHFLDDVFWVRPDYWQKDMGVWRASPEVTEAVARDLGYTPPDVAERRGYRRGARGYSTLVREADKQRTDYVDAFLIGWWALSCMEDGRVWDSAVVRQYK